jgi:Clp amino terminal domain, pathogenicity island component
MALLRRQPVPATLTTRATAHTRAVQETGRRSGADRSIAAGTPYIGTEHLLLSLLAEGDGIAAQVLAGRGAGYAQARHPV